MLTAKPVRKKLCKLAGCDKPRFQVRTLCLSHIRERERAKKEENKAKRLARKQASKKFQQSQLKTWRAKCWKLMSEWVRRKDAMSNGVVLCFTCPTYRPWKEMHAGHYRHGRLDYDERNLRPQCPACNTYHGGRLDEYALNLIAQHGWEWFEQLRKDAAQHKGYTDINELKRIHADLSAKLSTLQ